MPPIGDPVAGQRPHGHRPVPSSRCRADHAPGTGARARRCSPAPARRCGPRRSGGRRRTRRCGTSRGSLPGRLSLPTKRSRRPPPSVSANPTRRTPGSASRSVRMLQAISSTPAALRSANPEAREMPERRAGISPRGVRRRGPGILRHGLQRIGLFTDTRAPHLAGRVRSATMTPWRVAASEQVPGEDRSGSGRSARRCSGSPAA